MADDIEIVVGELERFTARIVRDITLEVTANLVEITPRDTGWAAANWIPRIGSPETTVAPRPDPDGTGVPAAITRREAGIASVIGYRDIGRGAIFISNNVPYIGVLNDGSSAKAPAMFIQTSVEKAVRTIERRFGS